MNSRLVGSLTRSADDEMQQLAQDWPPFRTQPHAPARPSLCSAVSVPLVACQGAKAGAPSQSVPVSSSGFPVSRTLDQTRCAASFAAAALIARPASLPALLVMLKRGRKCRAPHRPPPPQQRAVIGCSRNETIGLGGRARRFFARVLDRRSALFTRGRDGDPALFARCRDGRFALFQSPAIAAPPRFRAVLMTASLMSRASAITAPPRFRAVLRAASPVFARPRSRPRRA